MRVHLPSRVAAGVIAITGALACDSKTGPTTEPVVVAVELSGTLTVAPGATTQLTLTAVKSDGSRSDITSTAQWSSFGSNTVTSLGQGRFLGRTIGDAIITGREGRATATREMIVVPDGTYRINGRVTDVEDSGTAVAGARVRADNGGGAGPSTETDASGSFRLHGVGGEADLIVTRDGYVETTRRVRVDKHSAINLEMPIAGSRLQVGGTYTATFDWLQCDASFQSDLRRRVYSATVTQLKSRVDVRFISPTFARLNGNPGNLMQGSADAINVVIATPMGLGYYDPSFPVVEMLSDNTYLVLSVTATLSPTVAGFAGPVTGLASHHGPRYPVDAIRGTCSAGTLTLERQ
jgi:hypothetical protein